MHMAVARDIAAAVGAGADRAQCLLDRRQHRRVLPHAEIIVRAPHRDLGADAVIISGRKPAAAPLEIGKHPIAPLGAQPVEALLEIALVILGGSRRMPLFGRRESAGYLTRGGCGELVDRTLHPIAHTVIPHRGHLVVIGRRRLQTH